MGTLFHYSVKAVMAILVAALSILIFVFFILLKLTLFFSPFIAFAAWLIKTRTANLSNLNKKDKP